LKEKINSQNYPYTEEDMNERKREREREQRRNAWGENEGKE
jgi:hypothetical protein